MQKELISILASNNERKNAIMKNAMRVRNRDENQKEKPREEQRLANEKALFILIPFRFWV